LRAEMVGIGLFPLQVSQLEHQESFAPKKVSGSRARRGATKSIYLAGKELGCIRVRIGEIEMEVPGERNAF
jgi:hypothetical protein